jgi:hypothetical protein
MLRTTVRPPASGKALRAPAWPAPPVLGEVSEGAVEAPSDAKRWLS